MNKTLSAIALATTLLAQTANAYTEEQEITCLAQNIYFEARGEGFNEQAAVAHVTLNRVDSTEYPGSICDVVWQPYQFSWTLNKSLHVIQEPKAWDDSVKMAINVYRNVYFYDETKGATHYWAHGKISRPYWGERPYQEIKLAAHTYIIPSE